MDKNGNKHLGEHLGEPIRSTLWASLGDQLYDQLDYIPLEMLRARTHVWIYRRLYPVSVPARSQLQEGTNA